MSNLDIKQRMRDFITTNFYVADPTGLTPQASFLEQGIIDSTGVLEVVSFIEETFGISIQDSEMLPENLDSLQGLSDFIVRKLSVAPHLHLLSGEAASSVSHTPPAASSREGSRPAPAMLAQGGHDPNS